MRARPRAGPASHPSARQEGEIEMAAAKEIRTQIGSIKNTQKITSAMEMVAASKMRKAQEA